MCDIKGGGSGGGIFSTKATITIVYNYIVYNCTACNSCPIMSESYNWIVFNSHLYICKYVWKIFFDHESAVAWLYLDNYEIL